MDKVGLASDAELRYLLGVCQTTPVNAVPRTGTAEEAAKVSKLRRVLESKYGANDLYTGMGATLTADGHLGAREVMVVSHDTGLRLTDDNHILESLGRLTQEEFDSMPG